MWVSRLLLLLFVAMVSPLLAAGANNSSPTRVETCVDYKYRFQIGNTNSSKRSILSSLDRETVSVVNQALTDKGILTFVLSNQTSTLLPPKSNNNNTNTTVDQISSKICIVARTTSLQLQWIQPFLLSQIQSYFQSYVAKRPQQSLEYVSPTFLKTNQVLSLFFHKQPLTFTQRPLNKEEQDILVLALKTQLQNKLDPNLFQIQSIQVIIQQAMISNNDQTDSNTINTNRLQSWKRATGQQQQQRYLIENSTSSTITNIAGNRVELLLTASCGAEPQSCTPEALGDAITAAQNNNTAPSLLSDDLLSELKAKAANSTACRQNNTQNCYFDNIQDLNLLPLKGPTGTGITSDLDLQNITGSLDFEIPPYSTTKQVIQEENLPWWWWVVLLGGSGTILVGGLVMILFTLIMRRNKKEEQLPDPIPPTSSSSRSSASAILRESTLGSIYNEDPSVLQQSLYLSGEDDDEELDSRDGNQETTKVEKGDDTVALTTSGSEEHKPSRWDEDNIIKRMDREKSWKTGNRTQTVVPQEDEY